MTSPSNPPPLDAAARDELARKANAAKEAHAAYAAEIKAHGLTGEALRLSQQASNAYDDFRCASSTDVILALLAAAQRGEEDTRDAERYRLLKPHLIVDGDLDDADYASRHYRWVQLRDERVMVPDSWAGYADADAALDAARSATPTEGDDHA